LPSRGFSTLILGRYDSGRKFVCAGFCVTGLSEDTRAVIFEELKATRRKTCPFRTVPVLRDHFHELPDIPPERVRPAVVVEVEYRQRNGAALRHAELKGIRPDQPARQVVQSPQLRRGSF
jgi:ATP-dependent DNA ligase